MLVPLSSSGVLECCKDCTLLAGHGGAPNAVHVQVLSTCWVPLCTSADPVVAATGPARGQYARRAPTRCMASVADGYTSDCGVHSSIRQHSLCHQ